MSREDVLQLLYNMLQIEVPTEANLAIILYPQNDEERAISANALQCIKQIDFDERRSPTKVVMYDKLKVIELLMKLEAFTVSGDSAPIIIDDITDRRLKALGIQCT